MQNFLFLVFLTLLLMLPYAASQTAGSASVVIQKIANGTGTGAPLLMDWSILVGIQFPYVSFDVVL